MEVLRSQNGNKSLKAPIANGAHSIPDLRR
jgi:hypothetical protein